MADQIKRVGIIANSEKTAAADVVRQAMLLVKRGGRQLWTEAETARVLGDRAKVCADPAELARRVDLLLVFGGDGTMLRAAREIDGSTTPILGINIGGLGFLTAVPSAELGSALQRVWKGEFKFEARALLRASGLCCDRKVDLTVLNDVVIGRGNTSRMIELDVHVNGEALTRYRCDGLILSSATGSTAYSLAAGGAVVFPTAPVLALTPICPHTLSNRSLILPLTASIEVKIISPRPSTVLSADGQSVSELEADDVVRVERSRSTVRLMHLAGSSFCETLRLKLHWRGASV